MANKNNDRQQPPPNPFLLSSSTTTTTSSPASLFSRTPRAGEAGDAAHPSSTTTTTVPFGLSASTSISSSAFTPSLFTTQGQSGAFLTPFSSSALKPSPGIPSTLGLSTKDTTVTTAIGIFGNAQSRTTLFGGTKRSSDTAATSVPPKESELGAGDLTHPLLAGSSVSNVFGGSASGSVGGFGAAAANIFGGSEAAPIVFSNIGGGGGQEGQVSLFDQFVVPATPLTDPFKEARVGEAGPSSASGHQEKGVGGIPSKVFGGLTGGVPSKPLTSLLGKAASSPFGPPEGKAKTSKESDKAEVAPVSPNKAKTLKSKSRDEGQSSPPDYNRKEVTKIIVADIPDNCIDKDFLKAHFSKFGEIKRLVLNARSHQATVIYHTHHAASKAKRKGTKLHPMVPDVKIYYGTPARRRSEDAASSDAVQAKKKAIRTLQQVHQPSDLDPYLPLQRPDTEALPVLKKPAKTKVVRPSPKAELPPSPSPPVTRLSAPKKNKRSKSPGREAKELTTVTADEGNLAAVLECVAQNNNDRYTILKARDKLLRRERHRTSDLQQASYLAATCPDMCPELERYMRDVQYDLSATFEMTDGALDHRLVTKKFSRSSADKELPLPHELRPGPVLLRTMAFLVCNIISRVEEDGMEVDVWYNYLWNRTRAVRNDLMQQQLMDADAVAIMERCTRFHIYAAARLCEEPPDLYDNKMNTEHLTKSLQTLKELYHDLGEQGQYFPSEAEFRAYEMLLSLNDGEAIVNKYAQFRDEVQKSSHVQFALKVILAVTFNNYVKFFRLVRGSATYLQGCLLHRYFRQVRSRALETIVKSYMPPKGPQTIPLPTLTHILGFENEVEAVAYLRCHGIKATDGTVSLEKHSFIQSPEELPPPVRPLSLVEVNRTVSVGEVIQGSPIPNNPLHSHVPHNSFDDQGRLKPEARDASDQSQAMVGVPLGIGLAPVVQQPEAMQNYELVSHMKDVYSMVEGLVLSEMLREVSVQVVEAARQDVAAQSVASELLVEGVQQEMELVGWEGYCEVEQEEIERKRRQEEEEERQRKALQELRRIVADQLYTEYSRQFVESFIRQVCQEAVWEVSEEVALQELMRELPHKCCEEVVLDEATAVCREAIQELTAEQKQKVEAFMRKIALKRIAEHFQVWRLQTQKAQHRKQSQMTFPAACSSLSLCQQSQALGWGYARDPQYNMSAPQLARLEDSIQDALKKLTVKNRLMKECAWHPLPLQHHLAALVDCPPPSQHNLVTQYFKVLVCWEEAVRPEVMLWLRSKLGVQDDSRRADQDTGQRMGQGLGQDILQPLNTIFSFVSRRSGLEYAWVMREVPASALTTSDLRGTALLLFVSSGHDRGNSCLRSVRELLLGVPEVSFYEMNFEAECEDANKSWSLVEEDLVKPETSDRLQSLLLEFWKHQSERVFVASSCLSDLANDTVVRHFLEPALKKHGERATDGRSPLSPCTLIDLYNSILDTLSLAVADDDLSPLSWPPPELSHLTQIPLSTWNGKDARQASQLLATMKLPPLKLEGAVTTWTNLTRLLHCYAATFSGPGGEGPVLASHMDAILADARLSLEHLLCEKGYEETFTKLELHPLLAPWPQIIYACASYKLSGLPNTKVYYQPKRLLHFPRPASWVAACCSSDPGWGKAVQESFTSASRKRKAQREEENEERLTSKARTIHSKLLDDIAAEKQKCAEFEKNLESMLDIEEELKMLFNSSY